MSDWKCKQCGMCCHFVYRRIGKSEDFKRYYEAREGFYVLDSPENNGTRLAVVYAPCKYLLNNKCSIHTTKPKVCRIAGEKDCIFLHELLNVELLKYEGDNRWKTILGD